MSTYAARRISLDRQSRERRNRGMQPFTDEQDDDALTCAGEDDVEQPARGREGYAGIIRFKGDIFPGRREPIISKEIFIAGQEILNRRNRKGDRDLIHFQAA